MTVKELIETLQQLPLEAEVIMWDDAHKRAPTPFAVNDETVVL
jgi:hypothetical protein